MSLPLDEVRLILGSFLEPIRLCIVGAVSDYQEYPTEKRAVHCDRTRANIVRDHAVQRARDLFASEPRVRFVDEGELTLLSVDSKLRIRFKKLDPRLRTRNHETAQSRMFAEQEMVGEQTTLPGLPDPTNINAGYIINAVGTGAQSTWLVCPDGTRSPYWQYELIAEAVSGVIPEITPEVSQPPTEIGEAADNTSDAKGGADGRDGA